MKKIAIVGVYGEGADFTTGQAVKCYVLINWLKKKLGEEEVVIVNTYQWKKDPIRLFVNLFLAVKECKNITIMPAQNGIKVFVPLISIFNKMFNRSIQYIVIGGWLADMLETKPKLKKLIKAFDGVYVEAKSMKYKLEQQGLDNVYYMPNNREFSLGNIVKRVIDFNSPIKLCTYSRVVKEKGISDAIEICKNANKIIGKTIFQLDIYGKVAEEFMTEFESALNENKDIVKYCGVKNTSESIKVLQEYFALLFPTYYEGEGFAGTVLDSFASGTPIIANDWKYNVEIITDRNDGFIYPYRDTDIAAQILVDLFNDKLLYKKIQSGCYESAIKYSTDIVMEEFVKEIQ